ncbi:MAG: 23S rRNA (uracil(1939)-C(5))-methyltransferase RlmD [Ignavibacteria bacterium]|jgi:23S rRNA (uracil1939-C5)-methyltransferase
MKKGDFIDLEVTKLSSEGRGIAKVNREIILPDNNDSSAQNYVVFIRGAYPGERVKAQLRKIKRTYAEAVTIDVLSPSKDRIEPRCKHFGTCGGCKQQNLKYETQIKYKRELVRETVKHISGLTTYELGPIIPSEKVFYYRNKMEYSFSNLRWLTREELSKDKILDRNFALGLHIPKIYDKVLDIDECFLQSETSNKILNFTRNYFKEKKCPIYSTKTHQGYLRHLVIRHSDKSKDLMVNLVTSKEDEILMGDYSSALVKNVPEITTVVNNINTKKASIALGEYEKVFYGDGFIYDTIGKFKFRISANSFFQTNTIQAENLYNMALQFADFSGNEIVYDLYSGAGTIALFISGGVKKVFGFESVDSAVSDANENTSINNVANVSFVKADLYKSILPVIEDNKIPKPDVIIADPPRSGMHKNTVYDVINLNPYKIVYVSCNPATQARDLKLLVNAGYTLAKIKPVDMFPHTYHVENVALLIKK